uniref:Protein OSB3, chloroplastic/mitochondrial n=1 Tax=Aegilops tauschii TaxID=37682 RepID=M8CTY6_AEGTA
MSSSPVAWPPPPPQPAAAADTISFAPRGSIAGKKNLPTEPPLQTFRQHGLCFKRVLQRDLLMEKNTDRRADFPKFWIPVIFQDDLAQIAASHLQENDLVYVSGQLTGDVPPFKHTDGQANIQVVAHLLSFVDSKAVETDLMVDEEEGFMEIAEAEKKVEQTKPVSKYPAHTFSDYKAKQDKYRTLWNDVLANPLNWTDNRAEKANGSKNPKYPDFKNKTADEALWLDSAPHYVLEKLDGLTFNSGYNAAKTYKPFNSSMGKGTNTGWSKFKTSQAASPEKQKKEVGSLRFTAHEHLLADDSHIIAFSGIVAESGGQSSKLVGQPSRQAGPKDYYSVMFEIQRSPKAPDFKHKDTGEALWLSPKTPSWVTDALPPVKGGSKGARRPETLLS